MHILIKWKMGANIFTIYAVLPCVIAMIGGNETGKHLSYSPHVLTPVCLLPDSCNDLMVTMSSTGLIRLSIHRFDVVLRLAL